MKDKKEASEYTGFEALYLAALDSDVSFITGVPGYPVTSLMELFLRKPAEKELLKTSGEKTLDSWEAAAFEIMRDASKIQNYNARWFTNEKVALETALGASVSGRRALVSSESS